MSDTELQTGTWLTTGDSASEVMHVRKVRLEVVEGPDRDALRYRDFAQPVIVIGRGGTDLDLTDRGVSGLHAELRLEPQGYRLRDLGSTNGTFVGRVRVIEGLVVPGAKITVGSTVLRLVPLDTAIEVPLWDETRFAGMVGRSAPMRYLFGLIERVAATDATVMITGETGTGKELVAEAVHLRSPRARGPFVVLDCAALPAGLVEDHLFGHEVGAFTGAHRAARGVFEAAHRGTLFLDEIGELPLEVQPKLLRAVESRTIRRLGSNQPIACDVRLLAATNRSLEAEVNRGAFRADLYYRLGATRLRVPPLRERSEDIELLIEHFIDDAHRDALGAEFVAWARAQTWPGNVRELRHAVDRAIAGVMPARDVPVADVEPEPPVDLSLSFRTAKQQVIDHFERRYVSALLAAHEGNLSAAARAANVDRMTLYKLLERHRLRGTPGEDA